MSNPITKEDLAWLVVRCTGIVFVWFSLNKIAGFLFAAYLLTTTGLQELQDSLSSAISWNMAWPHAFWFVVYSILSYYFLFHGHLVHKLICFQESKKG